MWDPDLAREHDTLQILQNLGMKPFLKIIGLGSALTKIVEGVSTFSGIPWQRVGVIVASRKHIMLQPRSREFLPASDCCTLDIQQTHFHLPTVTMSIHIRDGENRVALCSCSIMTAKISKATMTHLSNQPLETLRSAPSNQQTTHRSSLAMPPTLHKTPVNKAAPDEHLQHLDSDALMLTIQIGDLNSFFKLPLEICNMIYEYLWGSKVISLKLPRSKIRVVAYRNCLTHDKFARDRDLFAHFEKSKLPSRSSDPKSARHLPHWLLISKLFLREAMAISNKDAHYVLSTYMGSRSVPYSALHPLTIMLPGLARSLTVGPLMLIYTKEDFSMSDYQVVTNATSTNVHFAASNAGWLANLAKCLEDQNEVQYLCVAMQYPYVGEGGWRNRYPSFFGSSDIEERLRTLDVCVDLKPLEDLLQALARLESLELAFLNLSEQQSVRHDVPTACLRLVQAAWDRTWRLRKVRLASIASSNSRME